MRTQSYLWRQSLLACRNTIKPNIPVYRSVNLDMSVGWHLPLSIKANVRREFHVTQSLRKVSEFRAHLSSVQPGCSLLPAARANPSGTLARQERAARFQKFVDAQCGSAGTQNFFVGLHAAMRLQTLPPSVGGTGEGRIEWEIDDAVFMESG
jgi:hypothetical protein